MKKLLTTMICAIGLAGPLMAQTGQPISERVNAGIRDCRASATENMPIIAWGADGVTLNANGNSLQTKSGPFKDAGLNFNLTVSDSFSDQLEAYMTCDSPYLRGTLGMLMAAAPLTQADTRTEQVVIYKHSWSAGDGIVFADGITSVADLKGRRVAMNQDGPHPDFLGRILADSGLSMRDVTIVWTQDLTGDGDTPSAALLDGRADAAMVILPDARILTSGGVGTGAEGSVQGATLGFSTLEATAVIGDYISVRRDYFEANRDKVETFVRVMLETEEDVRRFMAEEGSADQQELGELMGDILLGGLPAEEGVFLWQDAISDGWDGNSRHFAGENNPRGFAVLSEEVNQTLYEANLIDRPYTLATAEWDYAALAANLTDVSERQIAAFDPAAAAAAVDRLRRTGQIDENTQIDFTVYFDPASNVFPIAIYESDFENIIRLGATYSGAIVTIEGHADPLEYLRAEKNGATDRELRLMRKDGDNLSMERAQALMAAIQEFAGMEGITLNDNQFTIDGLGINNPAHNPPTTEAEWRENMRVVIRVLRVQSEATTFSPL